MALHLVTRIAHRLFGNGVEEAKRHFEDDIKSASKIAPPITIPAAGAYATLRGGIFGFFLILGILSAGFLEPFLTDDAKKNLNKWLEKLKDKAGPKVTEGIKYAFDSGKGLLEKLLPWKWFSGAKKTSRAKVETPKETAPEVDDSDTQSVVQEAEIQDNSDPRAKTDGETAAAGLNSDGTDKAGTSPITPRGQKVNGGAEYGHTPGS